MSDTGIMYIGENYPLNVFVANTFTWVENNPAPTYVYVRFYGFPAGNHGISETFTVGTGLPFFDYTLSNGGIIGFPMYHGNSALYIRVAESEMTLPDNLPTPYYLFGGPICSYEVCNNLLIDNGALIEVDCNPNRTPPAQGQPIPQTIAGGLGNGTSGLWTINGTGEGGQNTGDDNKWTMVVRKLRPDPESENVSVGPELP